MYEGYSESKEHFGIKKTLSTRKIFYYIHLKEQLKYYFST